MKAYFWLGDAADYDGEVIMACEMARMVTEAAPVIDSTSEPDE